MESLREKFNKSNQNQTKIKSDARTAIATGSRTSGMGYGVTVTRKARFPDDSHTTPLSRATRRHALCHQFIRFLYSSDSCHSFSKKNI